MSQLAAHTEDRAAPVLTAESETGSAGKRVVVVDYDPAWPNQFRSLRGRIAGVLRLMASAIEHVGSTSVPGLPSKPIIDIDVLLAPDVQLSEANARLARIGYVHQGDLSMPGREAYLTPPGSIPHRLYVCPPQSRSFRNHVALRNYLRYHPVLAREYGDLKRSLVLRFPDDRAAYEIGKSELVDEITRRAVAELGREHSKQ